MAFSWPAGSGRGAILNGQSFLAKGLRRDFHPAPPLSPDLWLYTLGLPWRLSYLAQATIPEAA
jgi:hypothetical protein